MKKITTLSLLLTGWFFTSAQISHRPNSLPQPFVTILQTEPEQPIEGGRVIVYFRFTNKNEAPVNGWIGADLSSGTSAPGKSKIDWPVIDLAKDQSVDGAIMVNTTDAGTGKKIRVFFYEDQEVRPDNTLLKSEPKYVIGEKEINIAALVNFRLDKFTINHTRARTTDTDWGSLYAVVDDVPVMEPASFFIGDFEDGTYPFKGRNAEDKMIDPVETGPIPLVPGQNSSLYIAYTMYNGGGIGESKNFLKGYAEATANPILFHGPRPGTSAAIQAFKALNPFLNIIGACDGFVVMDTITINTNAIFDNTRGGNKDFSKRYNTEDYSSQTGCGNTSDYEVSSSIRRMSNVLTTAHSEPLVFTKITQNRTVDVREPMGKEMSYYDINWLQTETLDRDGNFIVKNDPEYGYISGSKYHAPDRISRPLLVILRGALIERMLSSAKSQSLSVLNNGPLKKITVIIQLIPGLTVSTAKTNYTPVGEKAEKTGEDYGNPDSSGARQKIIENYVRPFVMTGEWRYKITSSGGSVYTGIVIFQQSGTTISGSLHVNDKTKSAISGTISGDVLNLSRDTGLETIQNYTLNKVNDTFFSGTYVNRGKYADAGTVEFFK